MAKPRSNYEQISFVAPRGTRAFYQEAAALAGLSYKDWMREVLHARAIYEHGEHGEHGVERAAPPIHPVPPPPLQRR